MQLLVILMVTLLGAAADDESDPHWKTSQYSGTPQYISTFQYSGTPQYSSTSQYSSAPQYSSTSQYSEPGPYSGPVVEAARHDSVQKATERFTRLYKEAAARAAAAPDDHEIYTSQQYSGTPQYSTYGPSKGPVGGPAPLDAVQKATEEFNRLYKEAAARAGAAPDDHEVYTSQQYTGTPQYSTYGSNKGPVGGPAPLDAVQKATEEFNRLYKEAAARATAAPDDHEIYTSQQYSGTPQYSSHGSSRGPVGGPAPTAAVQKATEEFNRLYKEAVARAAAAPDDHEIYTSQQYSGTPQYSTYGPSKGPVGGPAPLDAVQKATEEFNKLYKEAAARAAAAPDDHEIYTSQQYSGTPQYSSYSSNKGPIGGPAPTDAVQKATEEFNKLYKEAAARAAAAPDDHEIYTSQQYSSTPQYSSHGSNKGPVGGPAPLDAVQKATEEFNRLYKEAAARAAAAPDDHEIYTSQQYSGAPQYSTYGLNKGPAGGAAPLDAVQKATEEFNKLYKEAAERAATAPDHHKIHASQQYRPYQIQRPLRVPWHDLPQQFPAPTPSVSDTHSQFQVTLKPTFQATVQQFHTPSPSYSVTRYDDDDD